MCIRQYTTILVVGFSDDQGGNGKQHTTQEASRPSIFLFFLEESPGNLYHIRMHSSFSKNTLQR